MINEILFNSCKTDTSNDYFDNYLSEEQLFIDNQYIPDFIKNRYVNNQFDFEKVLYDKIRLSYIIDNSTYYLFYKDYDNKHITRKLVILDNCTNYKSVPIYPNSDKDIQFLLTRKFDSLSTFSLHLMEMRRRQKPPLNDIDELNLLLESLPSSDTIFLKKISEELIKFTLISPLAFNQNNLENSNRIGFYFSDDYIEKISCKEDVAKFESLLSNFHYANENQFKKKIIEENISCLKDYIPIMYSHISERNCYFYTTVDLKLFEYSFNYTDMVEMKVNYINPEYIWFDMYDAAPRISF